MSSGKNDDLSNTKAVANGAMPKLSRGKTWLGHSEEKQSGAIDLLILEAVYSVKEIAVKIERMFPGLTNPEKRAEDHIEHLQKIECGNLSKYNIHLPINGLIR